MIWAVIIGNELVGSFKVEDGVKMTRQDIPYFPVYKRPFFAQNFHFKNRGSLIHGSKSSSTSEYCSSVCRYVCTLRVMRNLMVFMMNKVIHY